MAEEMPSLHIDNDWKKQAQEEKRKLAEAQEKQRAEAAAKAATAAATTAPTAAGAASPASRSGAAGRRGSRETPVASFAALVNSVLTQAMMYLGEIAPQGMEPQVNLDMAKYQVDMLGILEDKTKNNLSADEQHMLDTAMYDLRARFINVASQYI